jgi:hypothetical protein
MSQDPRLALTKRTSSLSEYRNAAGVLVVIEVAGHLTSFGMLCALLSHIPGVEFADLRPPAKFVGPARMRFHGQDYAVTLAHLDYQIRALDPHPDSSAVTEMLLAQLREQLAQRARRATGR